MLDFSEFRSVCKHQKILWPWSFVQATRRKDESIWVSSCCPFLFPPIIYKPEQQEFSLQLPVNACTLHQRLYRPSSDAINTREIDALDMSRVALSTSLFWTIDGIVGHSELWMIQYLVSRYSDIHSITSVDNEYVRCSQWWFNPYFHFSKLVTCDLCTRSIKGRPSSRPIKAQRI